MKERTRKIFIMIVMAALIVSLTAASFAALTYGRYTGGKLDEDSPYEEIIDFVGATAFEVTSPDAFINAINNGYSYIKIADDAEEPFVINNNVADVLVNLVLDVNGHKIVRNSRNPLLNVRQSVSVVLVYDSSEKAQGGFYNPVGSALQTSGGTLTVGEGVYESGPRTGIGLDFSDTVSATVCSRDDDRTAASYFVQETDQTFPKLTEDTGDVYLTTSNASNSYLKADTYLIYTEEKNAFVGQGEETGGGTVFQNDQLYVNRKETSSGETTTITADKFSPICDVASCDFYYYYPVGTAGTANSPQTYAVVYGYNDVKTLAEDCTDKTDDHNHIDLSKNGLVWPYAAIRSEAGNTHARGGEFYTYFGEENTYSIYSEGGTMTVGLSGESDAPTFQAIGKGVCINMAGTSGSADQTLTIENGEFSSKIGDTIKMSGGEMEVKKGSFTKDAAVDGAASGDGASNGSAISISGGTLTSSDTEDTSKPIEFNISGSYVNGIYAKGGEINIANAKFDFAKGENNQGVYNDGGTSRAHWCDFTLPGDNNYGIHSTNGTTRASDCAITMTGEYAVGVYTTGGRALVEGGSINVGFADGKSDNLLTSAAVSTEGGEIYLAGSLTIESRSLGVTVRKVEETEGSLEIATDTITTGDGKKYEGITPGNVTIETPNATGIYINNGSLTNKGAVTVISSVGNEYGRDNGWSWVNENGSAIQDFNKYNGVYVNGGSLVSNGTLNVTFTGVQNDENQTVNGAALTGANAYRLFEIKSYAVRVEAAASGGKTEVSIAGGTISNSVGGGVLVNGGAVTLGVKNGNAGPIVRTTGDVSYGTEMNKDAGNWKYKLPKTGGPAIKVTQSESVSSTLTVYGGTYTAQQGDGIVTVGGKSYIHKGTFIGRDYGAKSGERAGPGASYSFKVYGGTANVYGGTFGGQENDNYINSSGAFVMGTSANSMGTANIYGGTFVVSSGNTGGQAGFSVYEYGNVVVDPKGGENGAGTDVIMTGLAAGLVIEGNTSNTVSVEIKGGKFSSTRNNGNSDGIWYFNSNAKLAISGDDTALTGFDRSGLWLEAAPAIENGVTITGGTITGKQDGIHYGSNGTAANGLLISGGTITGSNGSGLNLAGAPAASGAVTITGGTITGSNYGVYYGASGAVNDGLLIEGSTITGENRSGLYFAVNPWQNGGTNNVAIVGGTFKGTLEKATDGDYYTQGAISAPSNGRNSGLGHDIRLGDILKTHKGDGKVAYVKENPAWDGDTPLGNVYTYSIAVTVSSLSQVTISPHN